MSDFDLVLERLLTDPSFKSALAADQAAALAGYRLSAEERELLSSQVSADAGGLGAVETRSNQSSTFGLLTPLTGLAGLDEVLHRRDGADAGLGGSGIGRSVAEAVTGDARDGFGAPGYTHGLGGPAHSEGFGGPGAGPQPGGAGGSAGPGGTAGFGASAAPAGTGGFGASGGPGGTGGFGASGGLAGALEGSLAAEREAALDAAGELGSDPAEPVPDHPLPEGYRTRVDVDGDGDWDEHLLLARPDGGVDILVDVDTDGRVDFIGHDTDADGLVDSAQYDTDSDGVFDTHRYDDDGDGWLDRTVIDRP